MSRSAARTAAQSLRRRVDARAACGQSGQALVEFIVGAGVLVALLAGTAAVARLHDVQWASIGASRYAAFELATRSGPRNAETLEGHVRARFYEPADAPIRTADVRDDGARWRSFVPLWTDRTSRSTPMLARPDSVTVRTMESEPPGASARLANTVAALADRVAVATGGNFDVNRRGYFSSEIAVSVAPFDSDGAPLSDLQLTLRERTTVLGDAWASSGPDQVASRTGAFVPTAALQALRPVIGALRWALRLFEPAIDSLCLGRIDPELVPLDRLGAPGSGERGSWVAPC